MRCESSSMLMESTAALQRGRRCSAFANSAVGSGGYVYSAAVPAAHPPADYTARVIPRCEGVSIPLEDARILWQR